MHLVLFDVDGTLLKCHGQAGRAFLEAIDEVYDAAIDPSRARFAGRTDSSIVYDLLEGAGLSREQIDARLPAMKQAYLRRMNDGFLDPDRMELLSGVDALLEELRGCAREVAVGLLTGNWRGGAEAKLAAVGLGGYFTFGAFADDGIERRELPPVALMRAGEHHRRLFEADRTVIVGDTLHDVDCALHHGMTAVGVSTGSSSRGELEAAGAARVFESFEGVSVEALLGAPLSAGSR